MAYAAVTSLRETLSLHFLQSQSSLSIEDLLAQMRDSNENLGLLQQIVEAQMREMELDEEASSKVLRMEPYFPRLHGIINNEAVKQSDYYPKEKKKNKLIKSEKLQQQQLAESSSQNERMINAWDSKLLTSRLREVAEVKQKIVSLHQNLGLLQQSLEKSEIPCDDARVRVMKDLEAQIRDASFKLEERIEMELIPIYLTKDSLHITTCLVWLHQIFNEAEKLTDYQIRDGNEIVGLLIQIVEPPIRKIKLKRLDTEDYRKMSLLNLILGLHQDILQEFQIYNHDRRVWEIIYFKPADIRDAWLPGIYLANDSLLHITACLLRLHEIFNEAQKQTDYHRNELIRIQTDEYHPKVSLLGRIRRRGLQLVKGSSLHHLVHKKIIVSNFSKKASKFDGGMVGCEKLFEKILDQLLTQQTTKGRQVVSIVGMGGIGKTTLAQKVYEHPSITSHFDKRAWVTISQEYKVEQMLRCLLNCVTAASRDGGQDQLAECLRKELKEQRYLIVMDDIWSTTAWDSVQRCFPDDNNGSRILLTSRLKEVAEYTCSGNSPLNMPFLDADESWNLYCKVFGKTEFLLVFEQIGRDIVKKCKGLPLAITVVASLLSKTKEEEEKWKNVAGSVMGDSSDACSRILYLSYNQLPHHLKACFLYFGIFEEDYEISVKKLVRLWAAEGFLNTVKHVNLEKVAMECLQDLVDRSLVIVSKHDYNGKIKKIRIHDLLRDLCLREAKLENLLNVNGVKKPCRWISHTSGFFYNEVRFEDECFRKSHSFHLTHLYYSWSADVKLLFSHLKLLRVLDMRGRFWDGVIDLNVLANLVHLRYLALSSTYRRSKIKLFEHWNMQSLIVGGNGIILYSSEPSRIWKMPLLRNLCIGRICSLKTPSVVYRNLENISWLDSKLCTKDLFKMIPNLKTLGVDGGYYVDNLDYFYNFVHLEQLEKLSIRGLMDLKLISCSIPWPTSLLPNLKKLNFLNSYLKWSELSLISMLPNLEVLKLIDACIGLKWETSDGGFHRLKRLVIERTGLQYWNAAGDNFPVLECLEINECYWLEEIPRGFADITTLALIQIRQCRGSLVTSAKWIQDEQNNNYGNDALLVRLI